MTLDGVFGLAERGSALFEELSDGTAARDALVLEAARIADRLDELDRIIQGDGVLNLMQFRLGLEPPDSGDEGYVVEVKFQNVLSEARQQAVALSQIVQKIGAVEAKTGGKKPPVSSDPVAQAGENIISLGQMRAQAKSNRKGA